MLTDLALKFFKVSAPLSTTSHLGHKSLYLGCMRAAVSLKNLLQASPIVINASNVLFVYEIPVAFNHAICGFGPAAAAAFCFSSKRQVVIADVRRKPHCVEEGLNFSCWHWKIRRKRYIRAKRL